MRGRPRKGCRDATGFQIYSFCGPVQPYAELGRRGPGPLCSIGGFLTCVAVLARTAAQRPYADEAKTDLKLRMLVARFSPVRTQALRPHSQIYVEAELSLGHEDVVRIAHRSEIDHLFVGLARAPC